MEKLKKTAMIPLSIRITWQKQHTESTRIIGGSKSKTVVATEICNFEMRLQTVG